jgi:hypothetical protein
MVEVENLFAKMKIFEQRWSVSPNPKRVLVIRNGHVIPGRQDRHIFPVV